MSTIDRRGLIVGEDTPADDSSSPAGFDTVAAVEAARVASGVNAIRTAGYYAAGDGGGALYKRVTAEPAHAGKIQSVGGVWWEIGEPEVNVLMFGAVGNDIVDDATAINSAINAAYAEGGGNVYLPLPAVCYRITSPIIMKRGVSLYGDQGLASCIDADDSDGIQIPFTQSLGNTVINGLYIKGKNSTALRTGITAPGTNDQADETYGVTLQNVIIDGFDIAYHGRTVRNLTIDNCWFQNVGVGIDLVGKNLVTFITNTKVTKGAGTAARVPNAASLNVGGFTYTTGGFVAPESVQVSKSQFFGHAYAAYLSFGGFVTFDQFDADASFTGIYFSTIQGGLHVSKAYIEMQSSAALWGIFGDSLASTLQSKIVFDKVAIVGTATVTAVGGIQINAPSLQNQNNVTIQNSMFSGMANYDILANNSGQTLIDNNTSYSTATTACIRIAGSRLSGIVTVTNNTCPNAIVVDTASDLTNGYVRKSGNVINGVIEASSWDVTLADAQTLTNKTLTNPVINGGTIAPAALTVNGAKPMLFEFSVAGVNFNSANTDNAIAITLPVGMTRYVVSSVRIVGASASLTTATCCLFTAAAAGGTALIAGSSPITVSTTTDGANNNTQILSIINLNTQSFTVAGFPTLYFRVQTPQGSAATATVVIEIRVLP